MICIKTRQNSNVRKRTLLSGGEKKRCVLAAVLAMEPQILIMDEPVAGLDKDGQEWIISFISALKDEKRTIIIATHQKELINKAADEIVLMTKDHHCFQHNHDSRNTG